MNNSESSHLHLITANGVIHYCEVDDYDTYLKSGISKRNIERKAVREKLLSVGIDSGIEYDEFGKPFLIDNEGTFLSISHSKQWMAIYIASEPIGIDIEYSRESLIAGSDYFVNDSEQKFKNSLSDLQLIWGAKEAFFKKVGGRMKDLKNEVTISEINYSETVILLSFNKLTYRFDFIEIRGFWIVFG